MRGRQEENSFSLKKGWSKLIEDTKKRQKEQNSAMNRHDSNGMEAAGRFSRQIPLPQSFEGRRTSKALVSELLQVPEEKADK